MKESALKKVRVEYNRIKKEKETLISHRNELLELTMDEKVKRFLELSKLVDKDYVGPSEETMIMMAYQGVPEAFGEQNINSNHIMIFMGSYIKNDSGEQNDDYMTYETNPDTSYRSYMDLETEQWYDIDKEKLLEFENQYLTLYLPVSKYTKEEYSKKYIELQKWFKIQIIHRSQSDVIKELQKKYEQQYKNLHLTTHIKIDKIRIEEHIKQHPEDGYIEKFCLSQEEEKIVKLYRRQNSCK